MTIKHLIFSGGGPCGLILYSAAENLLNKKIWNLKDIKSIYATSAGGIVATLFALDFEGDIIYKYFLHRPWEKVFKLESYEIFNILNSKGFYGENILKEILKPILMAKNIDIEVTLEEFFKITNIDMHFISCNVNTEKISTINISHSNFPSLKLITALNMTCALPPLIQPVFFEGGCYIDGGFVNNFPYLPCLEDQNCEEDEILGFKTTLGLDKKMNNLVNNDSSIIDFFSTILLKLSREIDNLYDSKNPKYTVLCSSDEFNDINKWWESIASEKKRLELMHQGKINSEIFLEYYKNF